MMYSRVLVQVEPPLFTTDDDVLPNAFERPADSGTQQGMESTTLLSVDELLNSVKFSIFCIYVCMYVYGWFCFLLMSVQTKFLLF